MFAYCKQHLKQHAFSHLSGLKPVNVFVLIFSSEISGPMNKSVIFASEMMYQSISKCFLQSLCLFKCFLK